MGSAYSALPCDSITSEQKPAIPPRFVNINLPIFNKIRNLHHSCYFKHSNVALSQSQWPELSYDLV